MIYTFGKSITKIGGRRGTLSPTYKPLSPSALIIVSGFATEPPNSIGVLLVASSLRKNASRHTRSSSGFFLYLNRQTRLSISILLLRNRNREKI
jgi:hypothetical protein